MVGRVKVFEFILGGVTLILDLYNGHTHVGGKNMAVYTSFVGVVHS